jgi:DHA2 family methylenomycin A resistance protein-like MFS transporter
MSVWSAVAAIGLAAGPTVGGVVVDLVGWSAIFWVNVPVCAAAVLLALRYVPETEDPNARRLDAAGQLLAVVLLASLTFSVVEGQGRGWTSGLILTSITVAVVCLVAFVNVERRHPSPMLPLDLVRRGQLPVAAVVATCMTFGMYGMFMLASLNLQQDRGAAPIVAGLQMLPLPVVFALVSPYTGRLVTRVGPRLPMTAGMTLMGLGLLAYAGLGAHANLLLLELAFMTIGLGLALNTGPVVAVAVSAVDSDRAGMASGVANLARMFGAALGVAVMGTVLAVAGHGAHSGPGFVTGLRAALLVGAAVELVGAAVCLRKVRNPSDSAPAPVREPEPAGTR